MTCAVCGKKAVYRYSPDLDIKGLGACKKHQLAVHMAYVALITSGEDMYNRIIKESRDDL